MVNEIYMDGGRKKARPVTNRADYMAQRNHPDNAKNFYDARGGDQKAKARQRQYNYGDLLPDGVLKGCCHPSSTFPHDIDCNSAEEQERIRQILLEKRDETGLLELSGSANYGLHGVFRREPGKTILECQVRVALLTHTEMDTSAHDQQRVLFTGPATPDNLFYLDDAIFTEPLTLEESAAEYERLKEREARGLEEVPPGAKKANKHYRPWEEAGATESRNHESTESVSPAIRESITPKAFPTDYHGIPFEKILKKYWEVNNHGFEPTEGDRDTLTFQLASDLRHICGKSFEWLDQVIPCYDGFPLEEKRAKIRNALASKYEGMPQRLRDTLAALDGKEKMADITQTSDLSLQTPTPPEMPKKLPKLIALLVSRTPDIYKPAVAHAVFPALATHLWRTRFRYIDNKLHEATLMNVLMAGTGAGKDCISEPIDHIMADIRRTDAENMAREKAWKDEVNAKGANKDKRKRPEGLVIQEIDADMTNPAFVTRMAEADEHFLYVKLNEIDQFDALKGNGSTGQQFRIMCLAFDPNNRYGQTRIGTQSVTERVCIRFNWNATGTILKVQRYFSRVLTDGPLSRINFCTIPEREIGSDIPVYGDYSAGFDEELKPYIDRLNAARGEIDCPQAFRLARQLNEECAEFSRLSQSRVYENFTFRANVIAYLKACVLYVANNYTWDKACENFIRWSLNYDLWCKMQFFGEAIEQANTAGERVGTRGPRNLLEMLPDEFTLEDAKRIRMQQGLDTGNTRNMVSQWKKRHYVVQMTDDSFQKRKYRNNG